MFDSGAQRLPSSALHMGWSLPALVRTCLAARTGAHNVMRCVWRPCAGPLLLTGVNRQTPKPTDGAWLRKGCIYIVSRQHSRPCTTAAARQLCTAGAGCTCCMGGAVLAQPAEAALLT